MADGELERLHGADVRGDVRALRRRSCRRCRRRRATSTGWPPARPRSTASAQSLPAMPAAAGLRRHRDAARRAARAGRPRCGRPIEPPRRPRSPVTVCRAMARRTASSPPTRALDGEAGDERDGPAARPLARQRDDARRRHAADASAHSGVVGPPGVRPPPRAGASRRRARGRGAAAPRTRWRARRRTPRPRRPSVMSTCSSASMSALSVPGRTGSHSVPSCLAVVGAARVDDDHGHAAPLRLAHARAPLAAHDAVHEVGAPEHDHPRVPQRRRVDAGVAACPAPPAR